jgi:uncharacterized protein YggE
MYNVKLVAALVLCAAAGSAVTAQTTTPRRTVRAVGDATVAVTPDQATMSFSIETRAQTAQDASASNASMTAAVLGALTAALSSDGTIRTTGYSINPIYTYPANSAPVLNGYQAVNTVELTLTKLSRTGELLDIGTKAGATRVSSLSFGLKDPEPARLQALRQASALARSHAEAMVTGLGLHLGNVIHLDEGGAPPRVISPMASAGATATTTPIEVGPVSVTATVVMEIEIIQ